MAKWYFKSKKDATSVVLPARVYPNPKKTLKPGFIIPKTRVLIKSEKLKVMPFCSHFYYIPDLDEIEKKKRKKPGTRILKIDPNWQHYTSSVVH